MEEAGTNGESETLAPRCILADILFWKYASYATLNGEIWR
jgi:hypothetical protein